MGKGTGWTTGILVAAALVGVTTPAQAQGSRDGLVVDAAWVQARLGDPELVILHLGRGYADGHIPGAVALDLDAIAESRGDMNDPGHEMLELPLELDRARRAFQDAGVSDDSRVVFVFEGTSVPYATRGLWTLQVLGKDDGLLLDGGLEAWKAAGGALSTDVPTVRPGRLTTPARMERRVDRAYVQAQGTRDGIALVDARRPVSFDGIEPELEGRAGHIPGAGNLHYRELFTPEMLLRPASELRDLFQRAGVEPGDRVVTYCHIGLWGTATLFAARTLGFETALYDGSMTEWAADPELPLVVPGGGGGR